jgi:hypothetical protein
MGVEPADNETIFHFHSAETGVFIAPDNNDCHAFR